MISQDTDSVFHDAIPAEKRELRSLRQSGASGCIGHQTDSVWAFRAIQHLHQCRRNVTTVGNQFTTDVWFAQCKLEQTGDPINAATPRARHTVKCVRHTAHTAIECRLGVFIPGIAMSPTHADAMGTEDFDRFKCSREFGSDRYTLQYFCVFEQLPHSSR